MEKCEHIRNCDDAGEEFYGKQNVGEIPEKWRRNFKEIFKKF